MIEFSMPDFAHQHFSSLRTGIMLVLSSPSGAGKTAISRAILDRKYINNVVMSVSVTTRVARDGEINKKDYFFVSKSKFDEMVQCGELLEYAKVFDNYYGTPKFLVEDAINSGKDVLFDIDWQGVQQLHRDDRWNDHLVSVFILPPSMNELERRLRHRKLESYDIIKERMNKASNEMSHWKEYDYIIVNVDLINSVAAIESILIAEHLKRERQIGLTNFINCLSNKI
ncbi:MAG: guanylate kinase [Rhodospirillaceae bacterium]|jgi:guanylate kinase|nr:guanylate kinase [Rhodospirillaceae bacterium]